MDFIKFPVSFGLRGFLNIDDKDKITITKKS